MREHLMEHRRAVKVCTWEAPDFCRGCKSGPVLNCRPDKSLLTAFGIVSASTVLIQVFGLIIIGLTAEIWWPLTAFTVFLPVFFVFIEGAFLCSHCPFWAEDSRVLHCLANTGVPKLFSFKPYPMKRYERTIIRVCFLFFGTFSAGVQSWVAASKFETLSTSFLGILGFFGVLGASLVSMVSFFAVLKTFYCSRCINFSCPFNRVPKEHAEAYLEKNPLMKRAWKKSGHPSE